MIKQGILAPLCFIASLTLAHAHSAPVAVAGCFGNYTFTSPPERVVSLDPQATEIMKALGLADRVVGLAPAERASDEPFDTQFDQAVHLTAQDRKSRQSILALEPDLLIASDPGLFGPDALGNGASWQNEEDIGVYISNAACPAFYGDAGPQSFEPLLKDIQILGDVFHIKAKAAKLLLDTLVRLKAVQKSAAGEGRKAVLLSGNKSDAAALDSHCCNGAGILFDLVGLEVTQDALRSGWDALAKTNPQVIILKDEPNETAQAKRAALLADPEMSELTAVRKKHFIVLQPRHLNLGLGFVEGAETLNSQLSTME
nr:ABC transporter substrate-binding protein [uncultured Cohaesibacter sp.]